LVDKTFLDPLIGDTGLNITDKDRLADFIDLFWRSKETVLSNIAVDWATRLNFINSMFAALFSVFSIYSSTNSIQWLVGTSGALLAIFALMLFWVFKFDIDELVSVKTGVFNWTPATTCKMILILVNLILIAAIYVAQRRATP